MARKKKHEEHVNAEAWAIPYGDLVTLLLALFVVMYAMSSVNEGKYRILSDSMVAAFRGTPKSVTPINIGEKTAKGDSQKMTGSASTTLMKFAGKPAVMTDVKQFGGISPLPIDDHAAGGGGDRQPPGALIRMERAVQDAMQALIDAKLVKVRHEKLWLEVEINTDILFPSGSSGFTPKAVPVLDKLAVVLIPFTNPIRVEGHTDDRPIRTAEFPSNWELSAARAASVVHEFTKAGIDPLRLEIVGFGEFHPINSNKTTEGRNANRRVSILILDATAATDAMIARSSEAAQGAPAKDARLASPSNAENRMIYRVSPDALGKTILSPRASSVAPVTGSSKPAN